MNEHSDAELAAAMRRLMHPDDAVLQVAWYELPSAWEADAQDEGALRALVVAIAKAALSSQVA